ncbi:GPN-loop GTPase [Cladochytrium replicatum]|nr:GPN-loop GTPase [Cladochytrium replicatum]
MGPAGSGKSTYCATMLTHAEAIKRSVHLVNLDPAAENFEYEPTIDIRELISLEDVISELHYGPNGGLIYCMEYLTNNLDWLTDSLDDYVDDYLIIDCPGQIELYTHFPIMRSIVETLTGVGYRVCAVYLLDAQFVEDTAKFFSGVLSAMSCMVQLEVPCINVLSKMDLLENKKSRDLDRYLDPDPSLLVESANLSTTSKFHSLNQAIVRLIDDFNLVSFLPLNIRDEDSVAIVLSHVDNAVQYGEDVEPKEPKA